ncbi:MAG: glycosyltransferase family 4 protein [Actinomycetia bacterium]|nr:glycosyltransferase family 4 protein [Actinomycetes bacterium]
MTRKRVAVYNLYWSTYGGGEQVAGAIANALADDHDVVLLGPEPVDVAATLARLGIDLSHCGYERVDGDLAASAASVEFDVFINTTYLSTTVNRAPIGLYYVHFPGQPPTPGQRVTRRLARSLAFALPHFKNRRIERVHAGLEKRAVRTAWARSYTTFLANSSFTAEWVTSLWKVPSQVLYPPVQPEVQPGAKSHTIASIGRFFDPKFGHCKKQLDLLHAFIELEQQGADGWRLELVGGADAASRDYALAVRRLARDHAVGVHFNAPRSLVRETLAAASIFWHGGGFGEDPATHPERFEHFGIAVVEAMAAGAVPIVFGAAGPAEIVRHGIDGFHWHTPAELIQFTRELIADSNRLAAMSASAQQRANEFSSTVFRSGIRGHATASAR